MKWYLIYGLNDDFTYLEEFNSLKELRDYFHNNVEREYKNDYKIIVGNEITFTTN